MQEQREIYIYGLGAIGSLVGAEFSRRGFAINVLERKGSPAWRVLNYNNQVFRFDNFKLLKKFENIIKNSIILISVKLYDLAEIIKNLKKIKFINCDFILLMNGFEIGKELDFLKPSNRIKEPVLTLSATMTSLDEVSFYGGWIFFKDEEEKIDLKTGNACFFKEKYLKEDDFEKMKLDKLIVNSIINPLTAIFKIRNRGILNPKYSKLVTLLYDEIVFVLGKLYHYDFIKIAEIFEIAETDNFSSMLQDLKKNRTTEIDFFNGKIIKLAEDLGLAAPYNRMVREIIAVFSQKGYYD